jgi:ABC-type branched-subunit amino acid transport system substrate-binding protein
LLTAQASKAKVIALANAGGDTINSIKQASEFGLTAGGQKLAALAGFINDVHGLGLKEAQGLTITEASYWDTNDETRKWAQRFLRDDERHAEYASDRHLFFSSALSKGRSGRRYRSNRRRDEENAGTASQ